MQSILYIFIVFCLIFFAIVPPRVKLSRVITVVKELLSAPFSAYTYCGGEASFFISFGDLGVVMPLFFAVICRSRSGNVAVLGVFCVEVYLLVKYQAA